MAARALSSNGDGHDAVALDDGANRDAVLAELENIITHDTFRDTKRLKRFLVFVVNETLEGRGSRLKGYTLGVEVFDRPDDFDPQGDTIVRVQAGQLRRRLDLYYAQDGMNNAVRILLPKGRYEPVFELRREPPKLPLKTVAELTHTPASDTLSRPGILVPSIANLSGDEQYKYFSEGLTSEIVNALVQFRYLRIITGTPMVDTTTAMTNKDVAKLYNAQFVLSGSVRRSKDLMRISVNLINAETGAHLLSKTFDRTCTPDNIFEVQEEIASYVSAAVATPNGAVNRYNRRANMGRRADMRGYDALLRYFDAKSEQDKQGIEELIAEFDEVLKINPKFSSGWAAQSILHSFLIGQTVNDGSVEDLIEKALVTSRRAVTLHSENALAYHASFMANYFAGNFEQYEKDAAMAISLNPNDYTILIRYAQTRFCLGDIEGAKSYDAAGNALIAIPAHWNISVRLACDLLEENYDSAAEHYAYLMPSSHTGTLMVTLAAAGHAGDYKAIQPLRDELIKINPFFARDILRTFSRWHPPADTFERIRSGLDLAGFPDVPKAGEAL